MASERAQIRELLARVRCGESLDPAIIEAALIAALRLESASRQLERLRRDDAEAKGIAFDETRDWGSRLREIRRLKGWVDPQGKRRPKYPADDVVTAFRSLQTEERWGFIDFKRLNEGAEIVVGTLDDAGAEPRPTHIEIEGPLDQAAAIDALCVYYGWRTARACRSYLQSQIPRLEKRTADPAEPHRAWCAAHLSFLREAFPNSH